MGAWLPEQWGIFFLSLVSVIGAIVGGAVTVINALKGVGGKVDALEVKVDGRLSQLLERTASASKAEGVVVGRGEMATIPVPAVAAAVNPSQVQEDGTLVIGLPIPTPPVLLVPVDEAKKAGD